MKWKAFQEDNIPLRNNKCNSYRTRGRIPAKDNASRHAKGREPHCCSCDSWGDTQGHLEQPERATKPKGVSVATGKSWWPLIKLNNKNSWTLLPLFCFSKKRLFCPRATTEHAGGCPKWNFIHKRNFLMKKLGCRIKKKITSASRN